MPDKAMSDAERQLQKALYRQQWLRLLSIPALFFLILAIPEFRGAPMVKALLFLSLAFFGYRICEGLECPRCHDPIMFERGFAFVPFRTVAAIFPNWECPACLWPAKLTEDQYQRLVIDGEYRWGPAKPPKD